MTEVKRPITLQLSASSAPLARSTQTITPVVTRPVTMFNASTTNKRAAMEPRRHTTMTSSASSGSLASFASSSASSSSNSSSSSSSSFSPRSPQSSYIETPDSPSLILPYLYVGDQAQTRIDTISNLNISYILSLQSLPKFLDSGIELEGSCVTDPGKQIAKLSTTNMSSNEEEAEQAGSTCERIDSSVSSQYCSPIIKRVAKDGKLEDYPRETVAQPTPSTSVSVNINTSEPSSIMMNCGEQIANETVAKELLPCINSSKDYLVKFRSCVNRLIKGKCINISDTFEQYVDKFFDETHNFIEEARRNKCNILVHCKAGISRSPTIAIAYLMKWKRLHLQDAYDFVKRCRPQISPNLNFMGQLMNYERRLLQRGLHKSSLPSPTTGCLLISHPYQHDQPVIVHNKQGLKKQGLEQALHPPLQSSKRTTISRTDDLNSCDASSSGTAGGEYLLGPRAQFSI